MREGGVRNGGGAPGRDKSDAMSHETITTF